MNADERVEVQRFQELVKTLQSTLEDVNVFKIDTTVFIVGQVEGGYAGLQLKVSKHNRHLSQWSRLVWHCFILGMTVDIYTHDYGNA